MLEAAKARLAFLQDAGANYKRIQDWTNATLLPAIGGRLRGGQKFNQQKNPISQVKCEVQWAQQDHCIHLVANGSEEELGYHVQDPVWFQQNRRKTVWAQSDATALWVKLRGEEK